MFQALSVSYICASESSLDEVMLLQETITIINFKEFKTHTLIYLFIYSFIYLLTAFFKIDLRKQIKQICQIMILGIVTETKL